MNRPSLASQLLLGTAFLLVLAGCSGERFAKVHGKVSYKGKPLPGGTVIFANEDNSKVARVPVQTDGTYASDRVPVTTLRVGVEPAAKGTVLPKGAKLDERMAKTRGDTAAGEYVDIPAAQRDPAKSGRTVTIDGDKEYDIEL